MSDPEVTGPAAGVSSSAMWLLATPLCTLLAAVGLARDSMRVSPDVAAAVTFAGGALVSIGPLSLAARGGLRRRDALIFPLLTAAPVGLALLMGKPVPHVFVNFTLVLIAHGIGGAIGRRVIHPGHLLPASLVAASADVLSLVHPEGPSHAIAESERALSLLAIHFPVPGVHGMAPVLGLGDLVFVALVLGVVVQHRLSLVRASVAVLLGVFAAGGLAAGLGVPVPALIPIAAAILLGMPEARALRPQDRRTTRIAAAVALAVIAGLLVQRVLLAPTE